MLLPTTLQPLPSRLHCRCVPMTKPQPSQRCAKFKSLQSNAITDENPSQSKLKFRSSKTKFKLKAPLSPERPIPNTSELIYQNLAILGANFYSVDALDLAPLLLGKFIRRDDVILQITEVRCNFYWSCILSVRQNYPMSLKVAIFS